MPAPRTDALPDAASASLSDSLNGWRPRLIAIATAGAENDGDGAHDLSHLHRVWHAAQALLAEHPEADALVVLAACYLHDLVNLPKNHPERAQASRLAARCACERLAQAAFPAERLAGVAHAIEAMIMQDADRLDALGAVGLARLFYTAGRMGSACAHPDDPLGTRRPLDDRAYALDHIELKLAQLPAGMRTAAGRKLGESRLDWLRAFRATFVAEWVTADDRGM